MDLRDVVVPNSFLSGGLQLRSTVEEEKQSSSVGRMEELSKEEDPFWS
jgi:hypothetical protein